MPTITTQALLKAILPICEVTEGEICTAVDGTIYRYDLYVTKYPSIYNSVVTLFERAAAEHSKRYSRHFFDGPYSFNYARPVFKGEPNGKIRFTKLIIIQSNSQSI